MTSNLMYHHNSFDTGLVDLETGNYVLQPGGTMESMGHLAYRAYEQRMLEHNIEVSPWDELDDSEMDAWEFVGETMYNAGKPAR